MRSKTYEFECENDNENKNKLKEISESQSEHIKFEEYKICLDGEENENVYDDYILKSINYEMCLQRTSKTTLSNLDDKRK